MELKIYLLKTFFSFKSVLVVLALWVANKFYILLVIEEDIIHI